MQTNLTNEQEFDLQAVFTTALGNPAPVTEIAWAVEDDAVVTLSVNSEDNSKVVVSAVAPGTVEVEVTAKNASGNTVTGVYTVVVTQAEAGLVAFVAGEPRAKTLPLATA